MLHNFVTPYVKSKRRKCISRGQYELVDILRAAADSQEAFAQLQGLLASRQNSTASMWRCSDVIPPSSLLDIVCNSFRAGSCIPLEIPLLLTLHLISGFLLQRRVFVQTSSGSIQPKLWTIALADSAAGKSFTLHKILDGLRIPNPEIAGLSGAVSAAACFVAVKEMPAGLLIRDEFGQFVGRIESDAGLTDYKDLLLRLYDGQRLVWMTKKEGLNEIENPQVSVLGLTQHATWHQKVSAESMLDGFAARFSVLIAKPDASRKWQDYPTWNIDMNGWTDAWERCSSALQNSYVSTPEAECFFSSQFRTLAKTLELPEPFFRRILYSCHRLACIFHVICAKTSTKIDLEDYGWALRLARHHLTDAIEILGEQNFSDIERICQTAEALRSKCHERGEIFNERTLYRHIRGLVPATANVVIRLIAETK